MPRQTARGRVARLAAMLGFLVGAPMGAQAVTIECPDNVEPILIIGVFHSPPNNSFSSVIANGVAQAAQDYKCWGVEAQFIGTTNENDAAGAIQLLQAAIVKQPAGIFTSLPDPSAMATVIKQAAAAGIPVITYNSGLSDYKSVGAISHVGQDELAAGAAFGAKLIALGSKNLVCVNDAPGNIALDQRCEGMIKAFTDAGLKGKEIVGSVSDTSLMDGAIRGALQADPTIDAVGGAYCGSPEPGIIYKAFKDAGKEDGTFHISIFDVSEPCIEMVKAGQIDLLSSQSQFLQGYLPVMMLAMWERYGLLPGGGAPVQTGPTFIDKNNVGQYETFIKNKTF
jgi:simple sugar transport system substrate-binding protein